MRAAIYTRYSTDLQNARSIEDQLALCRAFAAREGLTIVATYEDHALSGASLLGRDGVWQMLAAAQAGQFKVLVVEELDRLSRNMADLASLHDRLRFIGCEVRSVHSGTADTVQVGIRGLLGQLFLQDLRNKVRRGLAGVVREGRYAGGRPYGYRTRPGHPGEMTIDEAEAAVIRAIALYVRTYNEERQRLLADSTSERARIEAQKARATASLARARDLAVSGILTRDEAAEKIAALRAEVAGLESALANLAAAPVLRIDGGMIAGYLEAVATLGETLAATGNSTARQLVRGMITSVTVETTSMAITVDGAIAAFGGDDGSGGLIRSSPPKFPFRFTAAA